LPLPAPTSAADATESFRFSGMARDAGVEASVPRGAAVAQA
jgi:hypothetical protein